MSNKFQIDFKAVEIKLQTDLKFLNEYIEFNIKKLEERNDSLNAMLRDEISESPNLKSVLEKIYDHDKIRIPAYLYHSTLVSLYSLLEVTLTEICDIIVQETNFVIPLDKIADRNIIGKSRYFLTNVANVTFKEMDTLWLEITRTQKLRNIIVHDNSYIDTALVPGDVIQLIKKYGFVDSENNRQFFYITNPKILFELLKTIEEFLNLLIAQLNRLSFTKFEKPESPYWIFPGEFGNDLPF